MLSLSLYPGTRLSLPCLESVWRVALTRSEASLRWWALQVGSCLSKVNPKQWAQSEHLRSRAPSARSPRALPGALAPAWNLTEQGTALLAAGPAWVSELALSFIDTLCVFGRENICSASCNIDENKITKDLAMASLSPGHRLLKVLENGARVASLFPAGALASFPSANQR